jgi:hypothetical protein
MKQDENENKNLDLQRCFGQFRYLQERGKSVNVESAACYKNNNTSILKYVLEFRKT